MSDFIHQIGLEKTANLILPHLNSGEPSMVANPKLSKTQTAKMRLRLFHHSELLNRHALTMGDTGCQAGHGRLVPGGQSEGLRKRSNVRLFQPGLLERASDSEFQGRGVAGPMIREIVNDGPVGDMSQALPFGDGSKATEELHLAEVATIGGIRCIPRVVQFPSVDLEETDTDPPGQPARFRQLRAGKRR